MIRTNTTVKGLISEWSKCKTPKQKSQFILELQPDNFDDNDNDPKAKIRKWFFAWQAQNDAIVGTDGKGDKTMRTEVYKRMFPVERGVDKKKSHAEQQAESEANDMSPESIKALLQDHVDGINELPIANSESGNGRAKKRKKKVTRKGDVK